MADKNYTEEIEQLFFQIERADINKARALVQEWMSEAGPEVMVGNILLPALKMVAEKYLESDDPSLAQGYVAAKVATEAMEQALEKMPKPDPEAPGKGRIVMGNTEDDFHALGRMILQTFLTAEGWEVYDIGDDVTAEEFVDKALEVDAPIIAVSAMMHSTALNIRMVRDEIDRRDLSRRIKLAVGGAIFNLRESLVEEVGGDGTCQSALGASRLMGDLLMQLKE